MNLVPLSQELIPGVERLLAMGAPFISVRTSSDYWLYANLFSSTCPVALIKDDVVGIVIAFRSQDDPGDVYVQDVMTHPEYRRHGIARQLIHTVRKQAADWGCDRLYLTSEPHNYTAHSAWLSLGFVNVAGDRMENDVSVISNFKGPGKHRAIYQLTVE